MLFPRTLKYRVILAVAALVLASGLTVAWLVAHYYDKSLQANMNSHLLTAAQSLALQATEKVLINDLVGIQRMLEHRLQSDPSIGYLLVVRDGRVLGHTFKEGVPRGLLEGIAGRGPGPQRISRIAATSGQRYLDVVWPILEGRAGYLRMSLDEKPYRDKMGELWLNISLLTLAVLGVALGICLLFARHLVRPLERLTQAVQSMSQGDRSVRVDDKGGPREVQSLSRSFNQMADQVSHYTGQLERRTTDLERAQQQTQTSCRIMQEVGALATPGQIGGLLQARLSAMLVCREIMLVALGGGGRCLYAFDGRGLHLLEGQAETGRVAGLLPRLEARQAISQRQIPPALLTPAMAQAPKISLIPLRGEGETFGALVVACRADAPCEPCELDVAQLIVEQASGSLLRALRHDEEMQALAGRVEKEEGYRGLVGKDPRMQSVYKLIKDVAPTDSTVLILGESGTGKELVAKAIHESSHRRGHPFVVIDCAAYPATLLESELFGHEKGAFTGATRQKAGRFEQAQGGTVFLDEVGEIPMSAQIKLLRVLQTHQFERLGGEKTLDLDVRILAATNKDLLAEVKAGRFREDLYYRLHVFPLELPPLRERRNDIPRLARHFLTRFAQEQSRQAAEFSPAAMRQLLEYHWPGNVRELENVVERSVVLARGALVEVSDLPPALGSSVPPSTKPMNQYEKQILAQALEQSGWNKKAAAQSLGISRTTLYRKMRKYGLQEPLRH
jgi:two-component system response regulator HydG